MPYPYKANHSIESITLKVNDLENLVNFYSDIIGLTVIDKSSTRALLGVNQKIPLIILEKTELEKHSTYGLYHTAILVPDEYHLSLALNHLLSQHIPLEGGADHGYSNAIYLSDPEGNGIEIYNDKDISMWDIRESGQIIGITERLDIDNLLDSLVNVPNNYKLSEKTRIGHIHLSVKDAKISSKLYQNVFGFDEKFAIPTASWIASGNYHHHLAFNNWAGPNLSKNQEDRPGIFLLTIAYNDDKLFRDSLKKAQLYQLTFLEKQDHYY
ncbi:VOC family protein, partial [Streptococcus agalactiae]|nr:VOC family protein [Streptococcus agalactiae]